MGVPFMGIFTVREPKSKFTQERRHLSLFPLAPGMRPTLTKSPPLDCTAMFPVEPLQTPEVFGCASASKNQLGVALGDPVLEHNQRPENCMVVSYFKGAYASLT